MIGVNVWDRAVTGVRVLITRALLTLIVLIMFRRNLGQGRIMMGTVIMRGPLLWSVGRDTAEDCETEIEF